MSKIDIKIKELHKQPFKDLQASQLILQFKGKTVYPSVTNTLRRMSLNDVPTYAFCKSSILIEENTSIFDNDYMEERLEQLTIPKINVSAILVDDKYWREVDYSDIEREKHSDDTFNIEMVINQRNNTSDIFNLTTQDAQFFQDGVDISNRFSKEYPLLLIKLRPGEIFKCTAKAVLGKGIRNNIWAAAATSYHDYNDKNDIKLTIESQGQLDEYDILHRCCQVMIEKLSSTKEKLQEKYANSNIKNQSFLLINFDREDHSFGEVLNEFLQENNGVAFSGLSRPDLLKNEIVIKMKSIKNDPLKPLFETMEYVTKIYNEIDDQLKILGKKYIQTK